MPIGIYKRTKEHNNNISKALKGNQNCLGRKLSEEHINIIRESHKDRINYYFKKGNQINLGRKISDETKRKMSISHKKRGITPEHLKKMQENRIFTPEYREKLRQANLGKKHSEESKLKMSLRAKENWKKPEHRAKMRIKERRAKQILPTKDTSIEVKIQTFLKELKIDFFTHQHMNIEHYYQCDILIPSMSLIIECDGDYWHKYPIGLERDHIRTNELLEKGFKVLRLWENEIKVMDINKFEERIAVFR